MGTFDAHASLIGVLYVPCHIVVHLPVHCHCSCCGKIHKEVFLCTSTQHSCYVCHKATESGVIHPHLAPTLPYATVYPHTHSHNPSHHTCTQAHTRMHTHAHTHVCTHLRAHTHAHMHMYIYRHTHTCTDMQTRAHTHTCLCTHTCRLTIYCMVLDYPRWSPHRSSAWSTPVYVLLLRTLLCMFAQIKDEVCLLTRVTAALSAGMEPS